MAAMSRPEAPDSRAAAGPRTHPPVGTPEKPMLADILTAAEWRAALGGRAPVDWDPKDEWSYEWLVATRQGWPKVPENRDFSRLSTYSAL